MKHSVSIITLCISILHIIMQSSDTDQSIEYSKTELARCLFSLADAATMISEHSQETLSSEVASPVDLGKTNTYSCCNQLLSSYPGSPNQASCLSSTSAVLLQESLTRQNIVFAYLEDLLQISNEYKHFIMHALRDRNVDTMIANIVGLEKESDAIHELAMVQEDYNTLWKKYRLLKTKKRFKKIKKRHY